MKKILIIAVLSIAITGCYNDKADKLYPVAATVTCDTTTITYAHDILPIITAKCNIAGGCHDAQGAATSNFDFTQYQPLNDVANNQLLGDIRWESGHNPMPKGLPKLSDCEIDKITRWVNQGALNN